MIKARVLDFPGEVSPYNWNQFLDACARESVSSLSVVVAAGPSKNKDEYIVSLPFQLRVSAWNRDANLVFQRLPQILGSSFYRKSDRRFTDHLGVMLHEDPFITTALYGINVAGYCAQQGFPTHFFMTPPQNIEKLALIQSLTSEIMRDYKPLPEPEFFLLPL